VVTGRVELHVVVTARPFVDGAVGDLVGVELARGRPHRGVREVRLGGGAVVAREVLGPHDIGEIEEHHEPRLDRLGSGIEDATERGLVGRRVVRSAAAHRGARTPRIEEAHVRRVHGGAEVVEVLRRRGGVSSRQRPRPAALDVDPEHERFDERLRGGEIAHRQRGRRGRCRRRRDARRRRARAGGGWRRNARVVAGGARLPRSVGGARVTARADEREDDAGQHGAGGPLRVSFDHAEYVSRDRSRPRARGRYVERCAFRGV